MILQVRDLSKHFRNKRVVTHAVEEVTLQVRRGETLGLVGESGCGKTTLGRTVLRLYEPTGGHISFDGEVIYDKSRRKQPDMRPYRRRMQMIFQDPAACLDPRMTVGESIGQALDIHRLTAGAKERQERIAMLLETVGLRADIKKSYPHEFSGGQQQRIAIARALAVEPEFLVCDEPLSALDMSIQAQMISVLLGLQKNMGLSYLFIGHDISVVRHMSDRIAVMYLGVIVELAQSRVLVESPKHPYTKILIASVPHPVPGGRKERLSMRDTEEPLFPEENSSGCRFKGRCPIAQACCAQKAPELQEVEPGHLVACYFP